MLDTGDVRDAGDAGLDARGCPMQGRRIVMTLIGVLSDTHGRLDADAFAALAECDRIIHAGDIGGPHILRELEALACWHKSSFYFTYNRNS